MSIRQGLLALLDEGPKYGYQLRAEFEARTGGTWPLNVGQVYTTLDRLARDELVLAGDTDDEGRVTYSVTEAGRAAVRDWFATPVVRATGRTRDELAIKLAMAATAPDVNVTGVIQAQRSESMRALRDFTRLSATSKRDDADLAWRLVLDNLIFTTEAEVRWLDHVETVVSRARRAPAVSPATETATDQEVTR